MSENNGRGEAPKNPPEDGGKDAAKRGSAQFPADAVITMHVTGNPKREGTKAHERFSHYEDGITVGAFIEAGGTLSTLRWDQAHDFIAINETAEEKAAWKKRKEAADARDAAEAEEKAKAKAAKKEEADKKKAQAAEKKAAEKAEKGNGEASSKTGTAPKAPPGAGASREAPPAR